MAELLITTDKNGIQHCIMIAGPGFRGLYEKLTDGTWRNVTTKEIVSEEWLKA